MLLDFLVYFGIVFCWGVNLVFLAGFARDWHKNEPEGRQALLALGLIVVPAFVISGFVVPRGGYGNDHDFMTLGSRFFTVDPALLLSFKEISPLFTDWLSDLLSGYSLNAIFLKNRLLSAASAFLFFAGLRRFGVSLAAAAAGTAFLFLNHLSLLNANAASTTAANLFLWIASLAALLDAHERPFIGKGRLLWLFSSMFLVGSARLELLPACLLVFLAVAAHKLRSGGRALVTPANIALSAAFAGLLAALIRVISRSPSGVEVLRHGPGLFQSFSYHLWTQNFAVLGGEPPAAAITASGGAALSALHPPAAGVAALCLFGAFIALGWAAAAAEPGRRTRNVCVQVLLLAVAAYFSAVYLPADCYPFQFMRHHLYFLVPIAYMLAFSFEGARVFLGGRISGRAAAVLSCLALLAYGAVNARAALKLNRERRTNDIELAFLAEAQKNWPAGCRVFSPQDANNRQPVIRKYFPFAEPCAQEGNRCLLIYASPAAEIFSATGRLAPAPAPRAKGAAWRSVSFTHAFYTNTSSSDSWSEIRDAVPVTAGFYEAIPAERAELDRACARNAEAGALSAKEPGLKRDKKPAAADFASRYDQSRDAGADIKTALAAAKASGKRVLVFVGGDWCNWCPLLDKLFNDNPGLAAVKKRGFITVKFFYDPHKMQLPKALKSYPKIPGYPHIYVLAPDGTVLESKDTTQLERGYGYDPDKFLSFLSKWARP
ncbi:MAG TPA: hypothetical protein DEQ38_00755 [Elusimicrobia bacterium]|nr:MAG: hypothetical protein A2089_09790 [Elusimicrobia bacterium GWD2_63_28]HCC46641.1 hypothetical protein [Elusimicrobiota bacterium]